jgi:tetratricopeptide (TPR) repeat protein
MVSPIWPCSLVGAANGSRPDRRAGSRRLIGLTLTCTLALIVATQTPRGQGLQASQGGPDGGKKEAAGQPAAERLAAARGLYERRDFQGCLALLRALDPNLLTDPAARAEYEALQALVAAATLPRGAAPLHPFASLADADKAYQGVQKAQQLLARAKQELPVSARVLLALAANFKTEPDRKLARQLADSLCEDKRLSASGADALPLLLVRAQLQELPERAIAAYADLLERVKPVARKAVPAKEWFSAVLQPAAVLADRLPADKQRTEELRSQLAKCYAAYARFVCFHLYDDWLPPDAKRLALDYSSKAVALDGGRPECWVAHAYTQAALPNPDWAAVEQAARKARELGPKVAAAHALTGYVDLLKSRQELRRGKKIEYLREADQALDQALALMKKDDEDRSVLLLNHSLVCMELGSYLAPSRAAERKKYLYAAVDLAAQAARLPNPRPDWVQVAWGNALEAVARLLHEPDRYRDAVDKFTTALAQHPNQALPPLCRGRCRYRWVASGATTDATLLPAAMKDLDVAIALNPRSRVAAEANYWKGMIYQEQLDPAQARAAFARAIELAEKYHGRDWAVQAREQQVRALLADAWGHLQQQPDEALRQADEAARLVGQTEKDYGRQRAARLLAFVYQLKAQAALEQAGSAKGEALARALEVVQGAAAKIEELGDPAWAAYVRGLAYEYQQEPKLALQAYNQGLQSYPQQAGQIQGLLLIRRTKALLHDTKPAPRAAMLKDLQAAARLVGRDADQASAWALAAVINTKAANEAAKPEDQKQYRADAIRCARDAARYAGETHPDRAGIRLVLATNLFLLAKETPQDQRKLTYLTEALERATEAVRTESSLTPEERTELHNLVSVLREEKAAVEERLKADNP